MSDWPPPDQINCAEVARRVHAFLDGELLETDADDLRAHIDACEQCLDEVAVVAALKRLLQRSCGRVHAPDALRFRIVAQVTSVEYRVVRRDLA